jgi:hypothetical protein
VCLFLFNIDLIGAGFLAQRLGIDVKKALPNQAAYIKGWLEFFQKAKDGSQPVQESKELLWAARRASLIADSVFEVLGL